MYEICQNLVCRDIPIPMLLHTGVFLSVVIIGGLLLSLKMVRAARVVLAVAALYGVFAWGLAFGPQHYLEKLGLEQYFAMRMATSISHTSGTFVAIFLLLAATGRRFVHDSFLYVASGLGLIIINLLILFVRFYYQTSFKWSHLPGDTPALTLISLCAAGMLLLQARQLAIQSPFQLKKSLMPFGFVFLIIMSTTFLSFKLQRDEIELLRHTQSLFLNSFELAIKDALDNEVVPLNLLLNFKGDSFDQRQDPEAVLSIARGILDTRRAMKAIFWITPNARLGWSLQRGENIDRKRKTLLKDIRFYTRTLEKASVSIVSPTDLGEDNRLEIVLPYVTGAVVQSFIVAQLDFMNIIEKAFEQIPFTRFNYGLFSDSGNMIASNIRTHIYPMFTQKAEFEIFGKNFTALSSPSFDGLSEYITFLPKLTMIFGFIGALLLGHLIFIYSNLLVSYDEVEGMVRDRTLELDEARRKAEDASHTKSLFLANMSHEIRTPLNILGGVSEMLAETDLNTQQKQYVNMFRQSCGNLLRLVNDLIDMSKVESGKIQLESTQFHIKNFIEELLNLYRIKASEKAVQMISNTVYLEHEYVKGDPLRLKQVLGNILSNAVKFTDKGAITLTAVSRGDFVDFRISDTGIGMPTESLERIFDRFTQVDSSVTRNKGGAGLGLSIARDLVKLMGGEISVTSDLGHGTSFLVSVPLEKVSASQVVMEAPKPVNPNLETAIHSGIKVLVTDDSPDNRELIKVYLKKFDCEIEEAENGQVALEKIQNKKYDVVLMDMQMPILDGYSATEKIRQFEQDSNRERTPIIALTAHALREDSEKCIRAGCDSYLAKPVSKNQLVQSITEFL